MSASATYAASWTLTLRNVTHGQYIVYGGGGLNVHPPEAGDEKLHLIIHDDPAREVFDQLGPTTERVTPVSTVVRERGDIHCEHWRIFYTCEFNYDLSTGKSFAPNSTPRQ